MLTHALRQWLKTFWETIPKGNTHKKYWNTKNKTFVILKNALKHQTMSEFKDKQDFLWACLGCFMVILLIMIFWLVENLISMSERNYGETFQNAGIILKQVSGNSRVDFSSRGASEQWWCDVDFGSLKNLDSGKGQGLWVMSYCCVSSPLPLHRRNLLHRAQALMHLRPL